MKKKLNLPKKTLLRDFFFFFENEETNTILKIEYIGTFISVDSSAL